MNYLFWVFCVLVLILALLFVVLPLWRNSTRNNEVLRDAANLEILRDQVSEMDADLRNGLLTEELYEQGKGEIQARLVKEVGVTRQDVHIPDSSRKLAIILAILLPLTSISLYLYLGNYNAALPPGVTIQADSSGLIRSEEGILALANQLRRHPENPNGWYMLATSYVDMQKYSEAVKAYEELVKLVPDEAQIWASYADVYGMANGRTLQGEMVTSLLDKALTLDPENMSALALSGSAAMERRDFAAAITQWQKMLAKLPPGSPGANRFEGSINRARELLAKQPGGEEKLAMLAEQQLLAQKEREAQKAASANPAAAITGRVSLSPSVAANADPEDTVFILARASNGPKMPLAVFRKQVKDLPIEFTLDDSMAMQPQLKLSGFDQVVVVARVSKSGTPMAQSGDLEGLSGNVKPGSKGLKILIDSVVQ